MVTGAGSAQSPAAHGTPLMLLAEVATPLTTPKSNHIVTMLPSFKAVMSEPLPFFPVGNWWRAKCDRNLIFFERPFTCSCHLSGLRTGFASSSSSNPSRRLRSDDHALVSNIDNQDQGDITRKVCESATPPKHQRKSTARSPGRLHLSSARQGILSDFCRLRFADSNRTFAAVRLLPPLENGI